MRYAKNCKPADLGKKYFSSSKDLLELIKSESIENFKFEVRKIFTSQEAACIWEGKVLRRLKVHQRVDYFNKIHNFTFAMYNPEVVKKVRDANVAKENFFKNLGLKGYKSRIAKGYTNQRFRWRSNTYKITFDSGETLIVNDLKKFANDYGARYDTLRGCASAGKPYQSKNILSVEKISANYQKR